MFLLQMHRMWTSLKRAVFLRGLYLAGILVLAIAFITLLALVSPTHNGVIDLPSGNMTIDLGDRVYFAGTGTDSDFLLTYLWNFGDPAIADSTVEDP